MKEHRMITPIQTEIFWPWEIKGQIDGPAVMFDVVSASYNIIYLGSIARRLLTVTKDSVLVALEANPTAFLIGETDDPLLYEKLKDRFIASNSPAVIEKADVGGKDIILITNNGTHAIADLINYGASPVLVGNYANISAVVQYLLESDGTRRIYLIPAGGREREFIRVEGKLNEDLICAQTLGMLLKGEQHDFKDDYERSRESIGQQYDRPPSEAILSHVFQENIIPIVPICFSIAPGIIEVKAIAA